MLVDTVVVGGGVIGCAVADALARAGRKVHLLDATLPGRATSASAGGLWAVGESIGLGCGVILHAQENPDAEQAGPMPLPRVFMDFLLAGNRQFPRLGPELKERTGIDVEVESGTGLLYLLYEDNHVQHARQLQDWLGQESDLMVTWSPEEVRDHDPCLTDELAGGVFFPGDNQVNPMLLAEAWKRSAILAGAEFHPCRVERIERAGKSFLLHSGSERWESPELVIAAGAWSGDLAQMVGASLPVFPVRGQIVCTETLSRTLRSNLSTPDCYVLQKSHGEVIVGSTTERSDFGTQVRPGDLRDLARGACRAVPGLASLAVKRTWAGLRPGTPDEFPVLGPDPDIENLYYATGGFRTGIVAAPITAELVACSILGTTPSFPQEPFLARRFRDAPGPEASQRDSSSSSRTESDSVA